jgi:hypothetical protein
MDPVQHRGTSPPQRARDKLSQLKLKSLNSEGDGQWPGHAKV